MGYYGTVGYDRVRWDGILTFLCFVTSLLYSKGGDGDKCPRCDHVSIIHDQGSGT